MGGMTAVTSLLGSLPEDDFPVPLLLLQHAVGGDGPDPRTALLQRRVDLPVRTALAGDQLTGSGLVVIPKGFGATVDDGGGLVLHRAPRGSGGDALLSSIAMHYGPKAVAVILTGRLSDGAQGVRAIKRHGGRVLVQDPREALAPGMPLSAIATGCVDFILPVERIGAALVALTMAPGGAALLAVTPPSWAQLGA